MPQEPASPLMQALPDEEESPRSLFSAPTLEEALFFLAETARGLGRAHQATVTLAPTASQPRGASATSLSKTYQAWGGYSVPAAASRPDKERLRLEQAGRESLPSWEERATKARGLLSVPLPGGAGHVQLFDAEAGDFTPEDEAALSGLATLAGLALEAVRLREENAALNRKVGEAEERFQALVTARAPEGELERLLREEQAARSQAEAAEQRAAFLSEASRVLASSSLDPKATLDSLAWLTVPTMADWCFVDVVDDSGVVQRMSVAHAEPADAALARDVRDFPPGSVGSNHPTTCVVRRAESVLVEDVSDAWLRKVAVNDHHYDVMKAVGFHCIMSVPLVARGRALGALTFLAVRPSRRYTQADLTTAQDLARRAALLLDNAVLYREARKSVLLRDEFLSIASHELKTPLTPLQLRLQALRRETQRGTPSIPTSTVAAQLDVVQRQVTKLSALVNGLLDVSRISSGRLSLDREPLDLAELARDVVSRFSLTANQAGCPVTLHARDDMRGNWDRLRVDQVLTNLLTNALKYGAGKPVYLSLSGDEAHVSIVVEDSGIGIAPEHLSHIFERFGRAVSERHYGGLGLGLYITRQIVESHGGAVRVHSTPGQGSRFEVVLPR